MASRTEVRQLLRDHDERRVCEIGNSVGVTLPVEWAAEHGVDRGDDLLVRFADDGSLVIEPPAE